MNEDCFAIDERLGLTVVADGMGGHKAGEVASRIAVETVVDICRAVLSGRRAGEPERPSWPFGFDSSLSGAGNLLRTSVQIANMRILETAGTSEKYSGMGTTIVAALVRDGRLSIAHVGDSRFYMFTRNRLRLLTRDDSWMAGVLSEAPETDVSQYQHHPLRNALTNVVGSDARTEVHIIEEKLDADALFLLTTDGVHGVIEDRRIEEVVGRRAEGMSGADLATRAARLIDVALARGTRDNCTAIVAQYAAG